MTGKAGKPLRRPSRPVRMRVWADSVVRLDERARARSARARAPGLRSKTRKFVNRTARPGRRLASASASSAAIGRNVTSVLAPLESCATQTVTRFVAPPSLSRRPRLAAARAADDAPGEAGRPPGGLRRGAQVSRRNLPERKLRQPNVARRVCVCVCVSRATRGHTVVDGNVAEIGSPRRFRSVSETPGASVRGVGPSRIRERRGSDQRRPVLERPRLDRARARFVFRVCRPAVGSFAAVHADGSARGTPRRRTLADHGRRRERARVAVPRIFVTRRRDQMRIQQRARGGTHDEARAVPRGELGLVVVRVPARAQAHSLQHVADACGFSRVPVVETEGETSRSEETGLETRFFQSSAVSTDVGCQQWPRGCVPHLRPRRRARATARPAVRRRYRPRGVSRRKVPSRSCACSRRAGRGRAS